MARVSTLPSGARNAKLHLRTLRVLEPRRNPLQSWRVYSENCPCPWSPQQDWAITKIVTTLCPGGKERMRRLMELVRHGRLDLTPAAHARFPAGSNCRSYQLFKKRQDGVIKVAIRP